MNEAIRERLVEALKVRDSLFGIDGWVDQSIGTDPPNTPLAHMEG